MVKIKRMVICVIFLNLSVGFIYTQLQPIYVHSTHTYLPIYPIVSSDNNAQKINATFDQKFLDFDNLGYFPQIYELK